VTRAKQARCHRRSRPVFNPHYRVPLRIEVFPPSQGLDGRHREHKNSANAAPSAAIPARSPDIFVEGWASCPTAHDGAIIFGDLIDKLDVSTMQRKGETPMEFRV